MTALVYTYNPRVTIQIAYLRYLTFRFCIRPSLSYNPIATSGIAQ